jgi:hypothetical protein
LAKLIGEALGRRSYVETMARQIGLAIVAVGLPARPQHVGKLAGAGGILGYNVSQ